ncbi:MAG: hypothetical protein QMC89_05885 [Candidatus Hodarchaeaceae archaeon]|nr:hypothetical protein [Candidatus Hodarchaeaceae archaeon]
MKTTKQMRAVYLRAVGKRYVEIARELGWKRAQTFTAAERQVAKSIAGTLDFAEELRRVNPAYFQKLIALAKREIDYGAYVEKKTEFSRKRLALKPRSRPIRRKPRSDEERRFFCEVGRRRWVAALKRGEVRKIGPNTYEVQI